ncbi:MAG: NADH-quinone oxidoreductase subunit L, partial [Planctomycetota bacterium]
MDDLLWLIPVLPLAGFLVNGLIGKRLGDRAVSWIGCLLPCASFVLSALAFLELRERLEHLSSGLRQTVFEWIPLTGAFDIDFALHVDQLGAVMILVVTGVGSLIHIYSVGYMKGDKGYARYFAYLNLFTFAMLLLVMGDNLVLMFVGWEGVGLCSYLL